jgi:hypothetical protein
MASLVDRGWATVNDIGRHHLTNEPMWRAEITQDGQKAVRKWYQDSTARRQ